MRRRVIVGNWKMYKTLADTRAFFSSFLPLVSNAEYCDIVVAPPFTAISTAVEAAKNSSVAIAGQNVSWSKEGAFTGEVSAPMLAEAGCRYVIIGHSERRQLFRETDDNVAKKTLVALASGLTPIVCLGETQEDRDSGLTEEILTRQFTGGPGALTPEEFSRILIAYEPVWAIGTGRTATPEIAADAHRLLRRCAGEKFSVHLASAKTIVWNGPMGVFEIPAFAKGTLEIAKAVAAATTAGATSIVGGGDSVAAVHQSGVSNQISHISTGGGASLEFLGGRKLPGVEALTNK